VEELEVELRQKAAERTIHKAFVKVKFADFTRTTKECVCAHPTREVYQALLGGGVPAQSAARAAAGLRRALCGGDRGERR